MNWSTSEQLRSHLNLKYLFICFSLDTWILEWRWVNVWMNTDGLSICIRSEARVCRAGYKSPPIAGCGFWMNREANTWCQIKACNPSSALAEISGERVKRASCRNKKSSSHFFSLRTYTVCVPYLWGLIILPAVDLRGPETSGRWQRARDCQGRSQHVCVSVCIYCTYVWMFLKRFSFWFMCCPSCYNMEKFFHAITLWH